MNEQVYLKRLDDDCLVGGAVHPSVAERLQRIMELPVTAVANLQGVRADARGTWLAWQFIPGTTLEELLSRGVEEPAAARIAHELRRAVLSMHAHGIVHGAIHGRNIIVDPSGRVWLTHLSPLLWSDPGKDLADLAPLLERLAPAGVARPPAESYTDERSLRRRLYVQSAIVLLAGVLCAIAIRWWVG